VPLPKVFDGGVRYATHGLLPLGIIAMGVRMDFFKVLAVGGKSLGIILVCMAIAIVLTYGLGVRLRLPQKLSALIGVGTAVCGGSAIVATAPVIEASDEDVAFSVTTITLFGLVAVFAFPILGAWLGMTDASFGTWAGISIHQTPQVVAAGFAYSEEAGKVATVVKLPRVMLLAPLIFLIGILYARQKRKALEAHVGKKVNYVRLLPTFVFGFLAVALLNTLGFFPNVTLHMSDRFVRGAMEVPFSSIALLDQCSKFLVTMAMAGVGLGVSFSSVKKTGLQPLYLGLFASVVLAAMSLGLIAIFGMK